MRVVLLGEFRADRVVPPLRSAGADVVVLGFADLGSFLGNGVVCGRLPARLGERALLRLLDDHGADVAVPNMGCPGQEQFLPVYASAAARWRGAGRAMPVHPEGFATLASDKVALHRVAGERGWPVPRGRVCDGPGAVRGAVRELGLPVLVKEARSEFHAGRHHVRDGGGSDRVCAEAAFPVLVQEAVVGEEFGVEFLSGPGSTVAWPVASLGRLDEECAPGRRVRVAPAVLPARARSELDAVVTDLVRRFGPRGPWQMDLAVTDDGRLRVIELNGRLGGVSNMSWAGTGLDPHAAHARAVLGRPPEDAPARRVALELPVPDDAVLPPGPPGTELLPFPGSPTNPAPGVSGLRRPVLGVPAELEGAARDWLISLAPGTLLNTPHEAVAQLACGAAALRLMREGW
ncbi:hypothetical protein I5Q34_24395 [Streptomyces sp. AV19]|uniref:ATP-grasp domain-containing protein n=1 Tax=Streptomyces sp. AV19 TaxID=2793068 RepID=UPI0018FEAEC1|nr:hypothetical protein [Streptomyces sp. AV19]MBH1937369.1 hypothetical protein [Streptomyces sp. AV19]MDG4533901.1 hypothetical protein [Streptomyces sp. AV19]